MVIAPIRQQDPVISRFLEHCHVKTYTAKSLIIKEGELGFELFYIISGSVTVQSIDRDGREIVLAYLNPGDFFGEIGMFDTERRRSAYVRAKTKCEIARISYERLKTLQSVYPDLLFLIASQMALRLRKTSSKVRDLVFTDVQGRVARTLLDLCKEPDAMTHPDGMQIRITRQEKIGRAHV